MTAPRDIRRCALQTLYQLDVSGTETPDLIRESLTHSPGGFKAREEGFDLGTAAWEQHEAADTFHHDTARNAITASKGGMIPDQCVPSGHIVPSAIAPNPRITADQTPHPITIRMMERLRKRGLLSSRMCTPIAIAIACVITNQIGSVNVSW